MHTLKRSHLMQTYQGHTGPVTMAAVLAAIPETLLAELTGRQLGLVASAINDAYHRGKTAAGAEVIDASPSCGAVWVDAMDTSIEWGRDNG